jgi:hypothetical protein
MKSQALNAVRFLLEYASANNSLVWQNLKWDVTYLKAFVGFCCLKHGFQCWQQCWKNIMLDILPFSAFFLIWQLCWFWLGFGFMSIFSYCIAEAGWM